MAKLKETTFPAKRCSVLRLTQEDDKILSRKVANLLFLSYGKRNAWRIESLKKKKHKKQTTVEGTYCDEKGFFFFFSTTKKKDMDKDERKQNVLSNGEK